MSRLFTIYCHTNRVNGKRYVGQTVYSMEKRWGDHISSAKLQKSSCVVFAAAIRKYGADAFDHQVLEVVSTQEDANLFEELWIEHLKCRSPYGYNLKAGGGGSEQHEDTKKLIGESQRARWGKMTEEERNVASLPMAESLRNWWGKMTPEEYETAVRVRAEGMRAQWRKLTAKERSARQIARQKTVSPERRSATVTKSWRTRREKYGRDGVKQTRTSEEFGKSIKMGWAAMSPESRAERVRKIKEGVRKAKEARVSRLVRINFFRPSATP